MASTTVLQFDPAQTNCQTDATYLADSNRASGFGTDAIWPSPLANKTLNQLSNYLFALFTAFAQKGYTTNDDDIALLTATCANFLTDADILPGVVNVNYSPTAAFNAATSNGFQMTLTGNITSSAITGITAGQMVAFYFVQDSVGGRTVVWPVSMIGTQQPIPTANAITVFLFRADLSGILRAVNNPPRVRVVTTYASGGGKLFNTTYQNTTAYEMEVAISSVKIGVGGGTNNLSVGTSSGTATNVLAQTSAVTSGENSSCFLSGKVQPGQWFQIVNDDLTLVVWTEYTWI